MIALIKNFKAFRTKFFDIPFLPVHSNETVNEIQ